MIGKTKITARVKEVNEAKDIIRVLNAIETAVSRNKTPVNQCKAKNVPIVQATPFPPLNFKNIGKSWPSIPATEARQR